MRSNFVLAHTFLLVDPYLAAVARLEQRLAAQDEAIALMSAKIARFERLSAHLSRLEEFSVQLTRFESLEPMMRDVEVDVAAIITELRASVLPKLLQGKRVSMGNVRHGPRVSPEAARSARQRGAAIARSLKPVGSGKGAVRTRQRSGAGA